jgi:hypothetical protein
MSQRGWIGVDLDGTLAEYDGWQGVSHIGAPVAAMVERVKRWLSLGIAVKVVTARCAHAEPGVIRAVEDWCEEHIGQRLPVTCSKDFGMVELWDDRCVQVEPNTGRRLDGAEDAR